MSSFVQSLNGDLASVIEAAQRSLVQVHDGRRGAGSGLIWSPDGLIITNAHVVSGRSAPEVTLPDGTTVPARIVGSDPGLDLAALSVDAGGLESLTRGSSRDLLPGELVIAVGHPWGVNGAATAGVMIATGAGLPDTPESDREWIAASLKLRPGHSGGPLIDAEGRLVGINTMITGPSVGLAVPIHVVEGFVSRVSPVAATAAGAV